MSILKILPDAIDSTANYVFGGVISNGVDLGATVAAAFTRANTAAAQSADTFARQNANAAFDYANTAITTSGGTITGNLSVDVFTANSIIANGTDLGTAVASAFLLANNASKTTTSDTAPVDPKVGDIWYDTVMNVTLRYNNDGTSNNWIDITGPQNAGYIYQSYSISPNTTTINETTGNTVIYTIATTNTADNTVFYWTNSGTTGATDFADGISNGTVTIINNSASITRSVVGDLTTEDSETIILSLRTGSNTGPVVAVSPTVTVGDTSITPAFYSVDYLVVAGGGPNGGRGGGGGAGGYLSGSMNVTSSISYTITVGAGGTAGVAYSGGNSIFSGASTITAYGGGSGGTYGYTNGYDGGSGGAGYPGSGAGVPGQGNGGGAAGFQFVTGGGGGAGAAGGNASGSNAGAGGAGLQWLNGNYYGGGGGSCGSSDYNVTAGGIGGGGTSSAGEPNTGGGGGTNGRNYNVYNGGSGIVIVRYLTSATDSGGNPIAASGGTETTSGSYTYRTFTTSDTFTA